MPRFVADCSHTATYHKTVTVEADDLHCACAAAIDTADASETWRSADDYGRTRVDAIAQGEHSDPWGDDGLIVPEHFTHSADLPLVRFCPDPRGGVGTLEVVRGRVLLTFAHPSGTVTTEVRGAGVPPRTKPLVTVRIRPEDGRPDVTVTGGEARVHIAD